MESIIPLVLTGFIGIGVGLALGILVCSLRGEGKLGETSSPRSLASSTNLSQKAPSTYLELANETDNDDTFQAPNMNIVNVMARALQPKKSNLSEPPKSITAQIDDILQDMLKDSARENQAIRLIDDPRRGVIVMVGLDQFEGVEAVPDPEIRSLINSAVAEWESRSLIEDQ